MLLLSTISYLQNLMKVLQLLVFNYKNYKQEKKLSMNYQVIMPLYMKVSGFLRNKMYRKFGC
jgi:hypothetical protein